MKGINQYLKKEKKEFKRKSVTNKIGTNESKLIIKKLGENYDQWL